jgi:hypothetical protein
MDYFSKLPRVSSIGVDGDVIELEIENEMDSVPGGYEDDPVVFIGNYAGQITVASGTVVEFQQINGEEIWARLKIKGSSVTFTI